MTPVAVSVGAAAIDRVALQPAVAITPQGVQLTTPGRAVAGATGARVGSAVLTVDPVTHGPGRDAESVTKIPAHATPRVASGSWRTPT